MCGLEDNEFSVERCSTSSEQEVVNITLKTSPNKNNQIPQVIAPDGGYGYVVVIGSFISYFIADGWAYSFGLLFPELLSYFQESHGKTAIIGALIYAIPLTLSPLVCALCNLYGCRIIGIIGAVICSVSFLASSFATSVEFLTITLGVFASIGLSMIYLSAVLSVTYYFDKNRGLAIGLAVTGSGLGAFAFPPLVEYLVNDYTWKGTLFLIGGIFLHVIVSSATFRPLMKEVPNSNEFHSEKEEYIKPGGDAKSDLLNADNTPININTTESDDLTDKESSDMLNKILNEVKEVKDSILNKRALTNIPFLIFCASTFIAYLWIGTIYVYLIDKSRLLGISHQYAAFLLSIIGIGRTVGQIVLGYLGDQPFLNTILLYAFSIAVCGIGNLLIPLCVNYISLCLVCAMFGLFVSGTYTLQIICLVNMLGLEVATSAFGILQLVEGVATFLGIPLTGWMYDQLHNYSLPFYIAGSMLTFSSLLLLPVFIMIRNSTTKN